jgi:spermidine synthase
MRKLLSSLLLFSLSLLLERLRRSRLPPVCAEAPSPFSLVYCGRDLVALRYADELRVYKNRGRAVSISTDEVQSLLLLSQPGVRQMAYAVNYARELKKALPCEERHILLLGLGGGSVVPLLESTCPAWRITGIDSSIDAVRITRRFVRDDSPSNSTFRWVHSRAEAFVAAAGWLSPVQRYDAILNDAYDGDEMPASLRTVGFTRSVWTGLNEGGVYLVNIYVSGKEALRDLHLARLQETEDLLRTVFGAASTHEVTAAEAGATKGGSFSLRAVKRNL